MFTNALLPYLEGGVSSSRRLGRRRSNPTTCNLSPCMITSLDLSHEHPRTLSSWVALGLTVIRRRHLLSQPPQQCARRAPQRPLGVPAPPGTAGSDTSARRVQHCRTRPTLYAVSPRPRRSQPRLPVTGSGRL